MEMMLNRIIPEVGYCFALMLHFQCHKLRKLTNCFVFSSEQGLPYRHSCEGPDDMVGTFPRLIS